MIDPRKYELAVKVFELLYVVFGGKKKTHTEVMARAEMLLLIVVTDDIQTSEKDEILATAVHMFEREVGIKVYTPTIIDNDYDADLWLYRVKPTVAHSYFDRYKLYLRQEGFSFKVIEEDIAPTCEKILSRCANPKTDSPKEQRRGLVVGDVQSGKTANYLALMNMAYDYGYKIVVLLAGMTDSLRIQTQKRTDKGVIGAISDTIGDDIIYCGVGEYNEEHYAVPFTNQANDFAKFIQKNLNAAISDFNKPVVLVVKKNKDILESVIKQLQSALKDFDSRSILIIDDEADNASISTAPAGKDPTTINRCIRAIFNKFPVASYVGFTATPFANIFINPDDSDENFLDLFPADFIVQLKAPGNYFGGYKVFPHEDSDELPRPLRLIDEEEENFLPVIHKKDVAYPALAGSVKEAILSFLLNCVVRTVRGHKTKHRSMMINISRFNDVQDRIYDKIAEYCEKLRRVIEQTDCYPVDEFIRNVDMKALYDLYMTDDFYKDVRDGHYDEEEDENYDPVPWESIQKGLYDEIMQFEIVTVNARNGKMTSQKEGKKKRFDYEEYEKTGARVIAIGGLVLSRGLTLEGLMVSYYSRNAGAYDTLLQMCRWFGYRPKYKDLCRVYMTQINVDCFSAVLAAVDNLKEQFKEMERQRKKPKDFGLMVRETPDTLETTLLITARNKQRNSEQIICQLNYGGEYADTSKLLRTPGTNRANYDAFVEFYKTLHFADVDGRYMARRVWKHEIADFISKLQIHYVNKKFDIQGLSDYIENSDVFEYWDVVIATGDSEMYPDFMGVEKLAATTRSFHTANASDKFIRIGGHNNRVLDPGILDSGFVPRLKKREQMLAAKNAGLKDGEEKSKDLTATDFLKEREYPLLVIYPIELKVDASEKETKARFNSDSEELRQIITDEKIAIRDKFEGLPLMAFAVAFPAKESSKKFVYRANLQKLKELTENLEINDEEEGEDDNNG